MVLACIPIDMCINLCSTNVLKFLFDFLHTWKSEAVDIYLHLIRKIPDCGIEMYKVLG